MVDGRRRPGDVEQGRLRAASARLLLEPGVVAVTVSSVHKGRTWLQHRNHAFDRAVPKSWVGSWDALAELESECFRPRGS